MQKRKPDLTNNPPRGKTPHQRKNHTQKSSESRNKRAIPLYPESRIIPSVSTSSSVSHLTSHIRQLADSRPTTRLTRYRTHTLTFQHIFPNGLVAVYRSSVSKQQATRPAPTRHGTPPARFDALPQKRKKKKEPRNETGVITIGRTEAPNLSLIWLGPKVRYMCIVRSNKYPFAAAYYL